MISASLQACGVVFHGAPVRMRVARQLGFKSVKHLRQITVTDALKNVRDGLGSAGPAKTMAAHATDLLQVVRDEWGKLPFFMDTGYVLLGGIPSAPSARTFFDIARSMQLMSVPVTSIKNAPAYQQEIRNAIAQDHRGVMIRLLPGDMEDHGLAQYLGALLGVLGVEATETDILIDLEYRREQVVVQQLGAWAISALPSLQSWRTVTLAAGCFPASISDMVSGVWLPVPRVDWLGWRQMDSAQEGAGKRRPSFGDYGIRCGGSPRNIPNRPDPNIRYSDSQKVLVRKGPNGRDDEGYLLQPRGAGRIFGRIVQPRR